jgi:hypothetical protein
LESEKRKLRHERSKRKLLQLAIFTR